MDIMKRLMKNANLSSRNVLPVISTVVYEGALFLNSSVLAVVIFKNTVNLVNSIKRLFSFVSQAPSKC